MSQAVEFLYAVPVGTIIAWYPPPNVSPPPGFAPCDGKTVSDADSPFNGMATPDLTNRFPLGAGGTIEVNQQGGNVDFNLNGWSGSGISTGPTQVSGNDNALNNIIQQNNPTDCWRYTLTTDDDNWNDGNHHHDLTGIEVPAPGWVALTYLIRIK